MSEDIPQLSKTLQVRFRLIFSRLLHTIPTAFHRHLCYTNKCTVKQAIYYQSQVNGDGQNAIEQLNNITCTMSMIPLIFLIIKKIPKLNLKS